MDSSSLRDGSDVSVKYSVVVPFYNEEPIVGKFHKRLASALSQVAEPYEMIFVNDGSRDGTARVLEEIARADEHVLFVDLRRNFGQSTALQAGIDHSRGDIIITMDGDLQHDPYEIPFFIKKIEEGYEIVSGWRVRRGDNLVSRRLPSRIANWLLAEVSGVELHDFGTTFKAYRRHVLEGVRLYGDMHRFIPAVCSRLGARICEIPIKNVRRAAGRSNYGISRTFRVALDIILLRFICGYMTRPLHFYGKLGMVTMAGGMGILGYGLVRKIADWHGFRLFVEHGPLMAVGFMLVVSAMWLFAMGLIGEMLMRVYFETSSSARTYAVGRLIGKNGEADAARASRP
jgi:glycosyltransferase involved in cell wall biosynthesis